MVPIGRPIDNVRELTCSTSICEQLVPVGVPGELFIGGESALARGYLERSCNLTAERFGPDPFAWGAGLRGCTVRAIMARYRVGRDAWSFWVGVDHQVKLRGHRIELG